MGDKDVPKSSHSSQKDKRDDFVPVEVLAAWWGMTVEECRKELKSLMVDGSRLPENTA